MPVVIKQPKQKEVDCVWCGATIGYVQTEVKKGFSSDYLGDKDYYNYIVCPCCSNQIHVKGG